MKGCGPSGEVRCRIDRGTKRGRCLDRQVNQAGGTWTVSVGWLTRDRCAIGCGMAGGRSTTGSLGRDS